MRLLVVSICLFIYSQALTQSFVTTDKKWTSSLISNPINPESRITTYFFADTLSVLDGTEYRRLMQEDEQGVISGNRRYFREENNVVYSRDFGYPQEIVNYDFNMSIGDSIRYFSTRYLVVSDIILVSTLTGGTVQQYTLYDSEFIGNSRFETIVLEGIGAIGPIDSESLFHWPSSITDVSSRLSCFSISDEPEYGCGLTSTDETIEVNSTLWPNPIEDNFYLEMNSPNQFVRLEIYHLNGALIRSFDKLDTAYDISDLDAGLYIVRILTEDSEEYLRVVKA